jgi:hypothetical protein
MIKFKNKPEELVIEFSSIGFPASDKGVFLAKLDDGRDLYIYAMLSWYNGDPNLYSIYISIRIGDQPSNSNAIQFLFPNSLNPQVDSAYILSVTYGDNSCLASMTLQQDRRGMYLDSKRKEELPICGILYYFRGL